MKNAILKMVMCALIVCVLPTAIVAQDWQTNTMQGSGSNYSSPITPVGATNVDQQATTTYTAPRHGITGRRNFDDAAQDQNQDTENSPIGDAVLPLLLMAMLAAGVVYKRNNTIKV